MARKIYIGSSNSARNVAKMYIGTSSIAHRILKGYIGEGGTAKLFYPIYSWNKYTVGSKLVYSVGWYARGRFSFEGDRGFRLAKTIAFDETSAIMTFSNFVYVESCHSYDSTLSFGTYYATSVTTSGSTITSTKCAETNKITITGGVHRLEYNSAISSYDNSRADGRLESESEDAPGDFIEVVYSDVSNAYPNNGVLNGYWYIKN